MPARDALSSVTEENDGKAAVSAMTSATAAMVMLPKRRVGAGSPAIDTVPERSGGYMCDTLHDGVI